MVLQKLLSTLVNNLLGFKNQSEDIENYGGKICIEYDCSNANMMIFVDILDGSELSVELLARTCLQIETGNIINHIYNAIQVWAENNPEKLLFCESLSNKIVELRSTGPNAKKLAVDPSKVFNLKDYKQ